MFKANVMQRVTLQPRPQGIALRARQGRLSISNKLVLVPTGDGTTGHLTQKAELPTKIELLPGKQYQLGREGTDLVINIPTVSGKHASLAVAEDLKVTITDLGSTNGTYVNNDMLQPNKPVELPQGAEVVFGDRFLAKFKLVAESGVSSAYDDPLEKFCADPNNADTDECRVYDD